MGNLMLDYFDAEYKYCQDVHTPQVIKTGLKLLLYWGMIMLLYWLFYFSLPYIPIILGGATSVVYFLSMNKSTLKPFSPVFKEYGFHQQWRIYSGILAFPHQRQSAGLHNYVLFQSNRSPRTIGTTIMRMKASALHVRPNYHDVLRKLYLIQQRVKLNFQVHVNKEGLPGMVYDLAITAGYEGYFGINQWGDLSTQLLQSVSNLYPIIQSNFPHFQFEILEGDPLFRARFAFYINSYNKKQKLGEGINFLARNLVNNRIIDSSNPKTYIEYLKDEEIEWINSIL